MAKRKVKKLPKVLSKSDLKNFLGTFNPETKTGFRNLLFFKIALATGMRCQEILDMTYESLYESDGEVWYQLQKSKSGEQANIYIPQDLLKEIDKLSKLYKHRRHGYLFTTCAGKRISDRYLRRVANEKGVQAGVPFTVTPHVCRSTAASHLLNECGDITIVQEFLRHANIANTMIYTKVNPVRVKRAVQDMKLYE
jgi:integrase/recombinase XerC